MGDTRRDKDADIVETTQFLHHGVDLLSIHSLRVEDRFRVIEDYEHLL